MKSYIGIDWSEEHHDVCILNVKGSKINQFCVPHSEAGFLRMESNLAKVNEVAANCHIAIETKDNTLVDFLWSRGYTLYVLPPNQVKSNRSRYRASKARDDGWEAWLIAEIVRTDNGRLIPCLPDGALVRQMRSHLSWIDNLTTSIKRHRSRLRANLLSYYPQPLSAFGNMTSQFSLNVVSEHPSPRQISSLSFPEFKAFSRRVGYYKTARLPGYYAKLCKTMPGAPESIWSALVEKTVYLARQVLALMKKKEELKKQVGQLFDQHPDAPIFASLPGAGKLLGPKLLVMFGDHRSRYPRNDMLPAIAGTCPVTIQTGKTKYVRFRKACNRDHRQTAQQFARCSIKKSVWAAGYHDQAMSQGKSKSHAHRCLANRWLFIIWTLWQRRTPYDEAYHLSQVSKHRQPLVETVKVTIR